MSKNMRSCGYVLFKQVLLFWYKFSKEVISSSLDVVLFVPLLRVNNFEMLGRFCKSYWTISFNNAFCCDEQSLQ